MLNDQDRQYLIDLAGTLSSADRVTTIMNPSGFPHHTLEGFRHIQISDKLAEQISAKLLDIAARIS